MGPNPPPSPFSVHLVRWLAFLIFLFSSFYYYINGNLTGTLCLNHVLGTHLHDSHLTCTLIPILNKLMCVNHCLKYGPSPPNVHLVATHVMNDSIPPECNRIPSPPSSPPSLLVRFSPYLFTGQFQSLPLHWSVSVPPSLLVSFSPYIYIPPTKAEEGKQTRKVCCSTHL